MSVLQAGSVVTGRLEARGRLRLHGTVRGDVDVDGLLEVGAEGVIEAAQVRAAGLVVLGRVVADVDVDGVVEVWKGATLQGDVRAASIDIESGAVFVGRSSKRDPGTAGGAAEVAPEVAALGPEASEPVADDAQGGDASREGES